MSKFIVYGTRGNNIARVGKRNRILILFLIILISVFPISNLIFLKIPSPLSYILISIFILLIITFSVLNLLNSRKIIKTGEIQFNLHNAIQTVNEKESDWNFEQLEKITLKAHMKQLRRYNSNEIIKTYLLSANFKDSKTQKLIIGNQSTDKFEKSLKEILIILSKKNKFELEIK